MTVTVLVGDCRDVLRTMADGSVNCIVTSPPYFGLRDYGVAEQIGLEATPDDFVAELVAVFREARRVLADDGTLWLNLGDSYAMDTRGSSGKGEKQVTNKGTLMADRSSAIPEGLKRKDLIGIPWRVAFALQSDGWYLRQDIIWHKPNPMPESVTDRCTKSHEYVFLLSKSPRYFYDADAIAEPAIYTGLAGQDASGFKDPTSFNGKHAAASPRSERPQTKRAHELAAEGGLTPAHLAAIRAVGMTDAGKARVTQSGAGKNDPAVQALADEAKAVLGGYYREFLSSDTRNKRSVWTIATKPYSEAHFATMAPELARTCILAGCPAGGTVLDPFGGAGTTALVADQLGRSAVLIELNPAYATLARNRIADDAGMFAESS